MLTPNHPLRLGPGSLLLTWKSSTFLSLPFPATRPLPTYHAAHTAKQWSSILNQQTPSFLSPAKQPKMSIILSPLGKNMRDHYLTKIKQIKTIIIAGYLTIWPVPSLWHGIGTLAVWINLAMSVVSKSNLSFLFKNMFSNPKEYTWN